MVMREDRMDIIDGGKKRFLTFVLCDVMPRYPTKPIRMFSQLLSVNI